jgi:hypothetical protein
MMCNVIVWKKVVLNDNFILPVESVYFIICKHEWSIFIYTESMNI